MMTEMTPTPKMLSLFLVTTIIIGGHEIDREINKIALAQVCDQIATFLDPTHPHPITKIMLRHEGRIEEKTCQSAVNPALPIDDKKSMFLRAVSATFRVNTDEFQSPINLTVTRGTIMNQLTIERGQNNTFSLRAQ